MTKHISTQLRFKDGTSVRWVASALGRPLTGLLNCLTGDIWQANLSGHLRDTAREKNISSDLGDSHANTFWGRRWAEPLVNPITLPLTRRCCTLAEEDIASCRGSSRTATSKNRIALFAGTIISFVQFKRSRWFRSGTMTAWCGSITQMEIIYADHLVSVAKTDNFFYWNFIGKFYTLIFPTNKPTDCKKTAS